MKNFDHKSFFTTVAAVAVGVLAVKIGTDLINKSKTTPPATAVTSEVTE